MALGRLLISAFNVYLIIGICLDFCFYLYLFDSLNMLKKYSLKQQSS